MKYHANPEIEIEAFQWTGLPQAYPDWIHAAELVQGDDGKVCMAIKTLEGTMLARPGDYIVKGTAGEFYPVKPDIFVRRWLPGPAPLAAQVARPVAAEGAVAQ